MGFLGERHRQAMEAVDQSALAKRNGDGALAAALLSRAAELEEAAARQTQQEPQRGILFRSAAWLALRCGNSAKAAALAKLGLAGQPSPQITVELDEVCEEATSQLRRAERRKSRSQRLFAG